MKKLLCLVICALSVISCVSNQQKYYQEQQAQYIQQYSAVDAEAIVEDGPDAAYADDWNSAIRYDADMQNMYAKTPTKFDKPLDMYMTMALALKYNYTGRMMRYQESLEKAGKSSYSALPEIVSNAGYINTNNADTSPDLKVAWNILDISTLYFMNEDAMLRQSVAVQEKRKVIQNILQEARVLYWKTLTAQRLLPVIDDTIEHITLDVDEMNAKAKELAKEGKNPETEELVKKRKYMEAVQMLSALKRDMETAHERLASLMGLHPQTEFILAGKEFGNFSLPEIKSDLGKLEWLALTNRPELKMHDLLIPADDLTSIITNFRDDNGSNYMSNPAMYNQQWCNAAREVSMSVYETSKPLNEQTMDDLRRQRMTSLILNQVYVGWARYTSSLEDFEIALEIAGTSENIAEDITSAKGSHAEVSLLEAARAISDETKASLAYVDLQDALGSLYATIGLDAFPYELLDKSPTQIALALRDTLENWRKGEFSLNTKEYELNVPDTRPAIKLPAQEVLPDVTYGTGTRIHITVPDSVFKKMGWPIYDIQTKAGLIDDTSLPKWLKYDDNKREFDGVAMPGDGGVYPIKVYAMDKDNNLAYLNFNLTIVETYIPSMNIRGLNRGRQAMVLKPCSGSQCTDETLDDVKAVMPSVPKTH